MKKTVGIYLINKHNNLLIVHPTNHNNFSWSIPKGEPEEDESLLEAAIREMMEETGIALKIDEIIPHYLGEVVYKSKKKILHSFLIIDKNLGDFEVICNSIVNLEKHTFPEIDDHQWINILEVSLIKKHLHESQIDNIDKINEKLLQI